ncbi:MAG TPA: COP23 domain-containing protein [Allocoleopsis sp.]
MQLKSVNIALATLALTTLSITPAFSQSESGSMEFFCANNRKGIPTTYLRNENGEKRAVIRWKSREFEKFGFNPSARCKEVSSRFQTAYNNGSLQYITNGTMNKKQVICTANELRGQCVDVLFTLLPKEQNKGELILTQLNKFLNGDSQSVLVQNSSKNQRYIKIDLPKFIKYSSPE